MDWEKTVVPAAEIGDYIVTARKDRNSDNWYLGAITNEEGRELEIPLDFLEEGAMYEATIHTDQGGNWKTDPYRMMRYSQQVNASSTLLIRMAPGGGMAVKFEKVE